MFDDIPENYRSQTADSEEEGWRYTHCGGVFDISWTRQRLPDARKHIIKKLPSMYHQFKERLLARNPHLRPVAEDPVVLSSE